MNRSLAKELTRVPIKENKLETPHIQTLGKNNNHQADILFLTSDRGYKYALVVVDTGSRLCEAIPLKTKSSSAVLKAFMKMYDEHNILKLPKRIEMDPGTEFKGGRQKIL